MFLLTFQILYNPGQIENNYLIEIFRLYSYKRRYQSFMTIFKLGLHEKHISIKLIVIPWWIYLSFIKQNIVQ
jgi:hypothetical protein